ncbi:MAG: ImmA/IrrE family metallo-endopeptidase [Bacteroidota bacterium]
MIKWAIRRAGHELPDFLLSNPKVETWLEQEKQPTLKQLEDFSRKLHIPFGYLLLKEPPKEHINFPFFRTAKTQTEEVSLNVYDMIQIVQSRQAWLREYLLEEGFNPLIFVGKFSTKNSVEEVVQDIRQRLDLPNDWAAYYNTCEETLRQLSLKIEDLGIIMNFNGVVGNSTKRKIKVEECRGFVLVDDYAPFMFINNADAKAAQMFTIIHELAHIWIGHSAGFDMKKLIPADDPIEQFCDEVAAEFLVPEQSLREIWKEEKDFQRLNRIFKVSPIVVARRALDLKLINKIKYFDFYNTYIAKLKKIKKNKTGGGDFYATTKKRISVRFASFINNAVQEGKLLYRDAYKLTGLKGNTYDNFIQKTLHQS